MIFYGIVILIKYSLYHNSMKTLKTILQQLVRKFLKFHSHEVKEFNAILGIKPDGSIIGGAN